MKLRELVELAQKEPDLLDYSLCLSSYMRVPLATKDEDDLDENAIAVVDFPIRAIMSNPDSREIRFALYNEDFDAMEKPDALLREVNDEERNG